MTYQPVIIIGAARSGTNMLRELLTSLPGVATWPCDEINYIWRHHNASCPHDELQPEEATGRVIHYVRHQFATLGAKTGARFIVEKTCANSLRVDFVDTILPEAKYLLLVRDGRDVVASAIKRWCAPLDLSYIFAKAQFVPPSDLPYCALRYLANRWHKLSKGGSLKTWGPRFLGMQRLLAEEPIDVVCAEQWKRCLNSAESSLTKMDPSRVKIVSYEKLVSSPVDELSRVLEFLGVTVSRDMLFVFTSGISTNSVGAWRKTLSPEVASRVQRTLAEVLQEHRYSVDISYPTAGQAA